MKTSSLVKTIRPKTTLFKALALGSALLAGTALTLAPSADAQQRLAIEDMSGAHAPLSPKSPPLPPRLKPRQAASGAINYQNINRLFLVHKPPQAQAHGGLSPVPVPTVIVLHSTGGSPERVAELSKFNAYADQFGFQVAYPAAVDRAWNDGRPDSPGRADVDDAGFMASLAGHLVDNFNADPARLFLVGLAEGGMVAQQVACDHSRLFAAVATINATLPETVAARCQPSAPMPILMIHGTSDPFIPFRGGMSTHMGQPAGPVLGAFETAEAWTRSNGCIGDVSLRRFPDAEIADGSRVIAHRWNGCRTHADVVLYEIERGGPTWPGVSDQLNQLRKFVLGRPNMDIDAGEEIWSFFQYRDRVGSPLFDPARSVSQLR
ncbi:MAG: PHB depolymerase family esterase [Pseudomonadota bacterium]